MRLQGFQLQCFLIRNVQCHRLNASNFQWKNTSNGGLARPQGTAAAAAAAALNEVIVSSGVDDGGK